ncbi:hypothetical protein ACM9HO_06780 [Pseudomonas sp. KHB2.9]
MAMDQQVRSANCSKRRKERGEEELRHRVRQGEKQMLADLMAWTEDTEQASVMAGSLRYIHSLGRTEQERRFVRATKSKLTKTWRQNCTPSASAKHQGSTPKKHNPPYSLHPVTGGRRLPGVTP